MASKVSRISCKLVRISDEEKKKRRGRILVEILKTIKN